MRAGARLGVGWGIGRGSGAQGLDGSGADPAARAADVWERAAVRVSWRRWRRWFSRLWTVRACAPQAGQ